MRKIEVGMIVRYAPEWCNPGEENLVHVVLENRVNPVTGKMSRYKIKTLNTNLFLPPVEDVEDYMIIPTDE